MLLSNCQEFWFLHENFVFGCCPRTSRTAKWAVSRDSDVLAAAMGDPILVQAVRMNFELISNRLDSGIGDDVINLFGVEIADSDGLCQTSINQFFHCLPCVDQIKIGVHWFTSCVFWEQLVRRRITNGPVDQIQIQVAQVELFQSVLKGATNFLGIMEAVPQLAGDPNVFSKIKE